MTIAVLVYNSESVFKPFHTALSTAQYAIDQASHCARAAAKQKQKQNKNAQTTVNSRISQVQNLALHCASTPRAVAIKSELSERKEPIAFPLSQHQQAAKSSGNAMAVKGSNQPGMSVPPPAASVAPSASSAPALPLSQLLLSSSAAPVILVPTSNVPTSTQGYSIGSVAPKANVNTQTLVVQPLQQAGAAAAADKGPVPIQPKTVHGHRLPVQVSPRQPLPILPAPPSGGHPVHNPPHIPVQLVGARQCMAGSVQAVALAQVRSVAAQENVNAVSHNTPATVVSSLVIVFFVSRVERQR